MTAGAYTRREMMTVAAARLLRPGTRCFVGIGIPSTAANLARRLHAQDCVLIYESGVIGSKPQRLPTSIGDAELGTTADLVVSLPEIFGYWLQAGRVDVGFLSAAQIDRHGNLNSTVIGDYEHPAVRLPGAGGAPEIAAACKWTVVLMTHDRRHLVEKVDFTTSVGHLSSGRSREALGLPGAGPTVVITDLGVLRPEPEGKELVLTGIHPGVTVDQVREATGWELRVADDLAQTAAPTVAELEQLRHLEATAIASDAAAASPPVSPIAT